MKTSIPFLLLICSVSAAELQAESDNEILPQERAAANSRNPQQVCAPDLHTVLREMSAHLAELRVEMRHLRAGSAAQAAKLKEMERKQQDFAQAGELVTITSRMNITEKQVDTLRREGEVSRVAFSASLFAGTAGTLGPFNTHTPLVFRGVVTNIGNAYNPHSGLFIAPIRGAYHFAFHISAYGHPSHPSAAVLVKNGQQMFAAYHHQASHYGSCSKSANLLLEVGDVVFLRQWSNSRIYDDHTRLSTFSGHLLYPM